MFDRPDRAQSLRRSASLIGLLFCLSVVGCAATALGMGQKTPEGGIVDSAPTLRGSYMAGNHAQAKGDLERAAAYYAQALTLAPDDETLLGRLFFLRVQIGDLSGALPLAKTMSAHKMTSDLLPVVLGVEEMRRGDHTQARATFATLTDVGVMTYLRPLLLAWADAGQGLPDAALADLEPIKAKEEMAVVYALHAGLIMELAGKDAEAEAFYRQSFDANGGLMPRAADILAAFYLRRGETDKAREAFAASLQENPDSALLRDMSRRLDDGKDTRPPVITASEGAAEALFNLATLLHQQGSLSYALFLDQTALALYPESPLAQFLLGQLWQGFGRYANSNKAYRAVPEDSPITYTARLQVADNLHRMERKEEAIAALRDLVDEFPDRLDGHYDLGKLLYFAKRYEESAKAYGEGIARIPQVEPLHWQLFYHRGISYERAKMWSKAEPDFLKALELYPDHPDVLNYLGYSWLDQGMNMERARQMIEQASQLSPQNGAITDSLGWVYYLAGNYPEALKHLERAVLLESGDPTVNEHFGDVLWRVGREREARFQWERVLTLDPDPEIADRVKGKLADGMPPAPSGN